MYPYLTINSEEPAPVQHQHFPPPTAAPAPAPTSSSSNRAEELWRRRKTSNKRRPRGVFQSAQEVSGYEGPLGSLCERVSNQGSRPCLKLMKQPKGQGKMAPSNHPSRIQPQKLWASYHVRRPNKSNSLPNAKKSTTPTH
eukprot:1149326-Pelagomonas_calceolata.AAC.1